MDRRLLPLISFITLISYTIVAHAQENQVQINILTFKQERYDNHLTDVIIKHNFVNENTFHQIWILVMLFQKRFYDGSDFSLSFEPGIVDDAKEGFQGNFTVKLGCVSEDTQNMGITCER